MKVVFDSNIYELADSQIGNPKETLNHFNYLENLVGFIKEKKGLRVIFSLNEFQAINDATSHPWLQYDNISNMSQQLAVRSLFNDFLGLLDYDFSEDNEAIAIPLYELRHNSKDSSLFYNEFLKHIAQIDDYSKFIICMGTANRNVPLPLCYEVNGRIIETTPITDVDSVETKSFSDDYRKWLMFSENFIRPTLLQPLPNTKWCNEYSDILKRLISDTADKKPVYKKVVREVALRNGYTENKKLSSLNSEKSGHIRMIYQYKSTNMIYLSTDVEKGTIELCDHSGYHRGEYSYIGKKLHEEDNKGHHDIDVGNGKPKRPRHK